MSSPKRFCKPRGNLSRGRRACSWGIRMQAAQGSPANERHLPNGSGPVYAPLCSGTALTSTLPCEMVPQHPGMQAGGRPRSKPVYFSHRASLSAFLGNYVSAYRFDIAYALRASNRTIGSQLIIPAGMS